MLLESHLSAQCCRRGRLLPGRPANGANSLEQTDVTLRGLVAKSVHARLGVTKESLRLMVPNVDTPRRIFERHWVAASSTRGSRRVGRREVRTSAMKTEVRGTGEASAHLSGRPFCKRSRAHLSESYDKRKGVPWASRFFVLANFTLSGRRGTVHCRSSFVRKPRPPFRADRFQSWDARRLVRRNAACPRNRLVFRRPSLEWFDFQK